MGVTGGTLHNDVSTKRAPSDTTTAQQHPIAPTSSTVTPYSASPSCPKSWVGEPPPPNGEDTTGDRALGRACGGGGERGARSGWQQKARGQGEKGQYKIANGTSRTGGKQKAAITCSRPAFCPRACRGSCWLGTCHPLRHLQHRHHHARPRPWGSSRPVGGAQGAAGRGWQGGHSDTHALNTSQPKQHGHMALREGVWAWWGEGATRGIARRTTQTAQGQGRAWAGLRLWAWVHTGHVQKRVCLLDGVHALGVVPHGAHDVAGERAVDKAQRARLLTVPLPMGRVQGRGPHNSTAAAHTAAGSPTDGCKVGAFPTVIPRRTHEHTHAPCRWRRSNTEALQGRTLPHSTRVETRYLGPWVTPTRRGRRPDQTSNHRNPAPQLTNVCCRAPRLIAQSVQQRARFRVGGQVQGGVAVPVGHTQHHARRQQGLDDLGEPPCTGKVQGSVPAAVNVRHGEPLPEQDPHHLQVTLPIAKGVGSQGAQAHKGRRGAVVGGWLRGCVRKLGVAVCGCQWGGERRQGDVNTKTATACVTPHTLNAAQCSGEFTGTRPSEGASPSPPSRGDATFIQARYRAAPPPSSRMSTTWAVGGAAQTCQGQDSKPSITP
jgi:hypothetical protein